MWDTYGEYTRNIGKDLWETRENTAETNIFEDTWKTYFGTYQNVELNILENVGNVGHTETYCTLRCDMLGQYGTILYGTIFEHIGRYETHMENSSVWR